MDLTTLPMCSFIYLEKTKESNLYSDNNTLKLGKKLINLESKFLSFIDLFFSSKIKFAFSAFSNVTKSIVNVDYFKVHENKDGTVDRTKTDLYLHLVNKNDNSVIEVSEVLRLVDQNIEQLDELFKEFNVLDTQASEALVLQAELGNHTQAIIWLVMVNLIMGALLIIVITLCLSQRTNYRRELKAARVNAYG
jgi:hypothetical protein